MRRKLLALFIGCLFVLMMSLHLLPLDETISELLHYYKDNFFMDTGASNAVTAIYLNYRVFDTIFEALLLLVSIIGIIYFSRHEGDVE